MANILFSIDCPENFLPLFLKTVYQYLFTFASIFVFHKASEQNLYLALLAFLSIKIEFSALCFRYKVVYPAVQGRFNFGELLSYKAVRRWECTLKLVVKRSCEGTWKWSTCQPRSQCFSIPFIFFNLYFASNRMSSQGAIYVRLLPWHYNDIKYQNNVVHC